jgi:hypothetical protein
MQSPLLSLPALLVHFNLALIHPSPELSLLSSLFLSSALLFSPLLSSLTTFIPTLITHPLHVPSVWMVIARCDGGSGQLLGQAASSSLDGVRAWICAVILLSSRYRSLSMSLSLSCMMICCFVHTNTC